MSTIRKLEEDGVKTVYPQTFVNIAEFDLMDCGCIYLSKENMINFFESSALEKNDMVIAI